MFSTSGIGKALLTLLISNNFAEIKSSVFKKFDKHNLFQLSCHDVVERFKLALFLAMIMLLNVCQGGLDDPIAQVGWLVVLCLQVPTARCRGRVSITFDVNAGRLEESAPRRDGAIPAVCRRGYAVVQCTETVLTALNLWPRAAVLDDPHDGHSAGPIRITREAAAADPGLSGKKRGDSERLRPSAHARAETCAVLVLCFRRGSSSRYS